MISTSEPTTPLRRHTGVLYFPIAFIARLPFAMMVVGVLTLVVSVRGSLSLGGVNSAMVGLGTACLGPLLGAAADRFGQRPVLLGAGIANAVALVAFAGVVHSDLPDVAVLALAFLIGTTAPQVGPMSRSRLVQIISGRLDPRRRARAFSSTMAYESAADETVFVVGPFLVGVLAAAVAPWLPLVAAAALTLVFVTAFALHPTGVVVAHDGDTETVVDPVGGLFRPALVVVVVGILGVGLFFGATLTSLTAFMNDRGQPELAGLVYGVMGVGSAAFALGVALLPERFSSAARWLVFAAVVLAGTLALPFIGSVTALAVALGVIGIGVGPTLVTQYSVGARRSPAGRSNTVMTVLGSAVIVGQALGAAVTGEVAERVGTVAALALPAVAAAVVVAAGLANWWITGPQEDGPRSGRPAGDGARSPAGPASRRRPEPATAQV